VPPWMPMKKRKRRVKALYLKNSFEVRGCGLSSRSPSEAATSTRFPPPLSLCYMENGDQWRGVQQRRTLELRIADLLRKTNREPGRPDPSGGSCWVEAKGKREPNRT